MNWWIAWLVVYIAVIYGIGVYYSRKIESADEYVMADFSLGFFPIAGSIIATCMGAAAVIGSAGKGFTMGVAWQVMTSPYVIFSLILCFVLGGTIRKMKLYTVPDLFVRRFGKAAGLIPALVISILYMTPTFGMQVVGMGSILTSIIGMKLGIAMLVGFVLCVGFTLMGGLPSVAWTDAIQAVLIIVGLIVMAIMGINHVGGMGEFIANTPKEYFNPFGVDGKTMMNFAIIYGPFYLVWQTTWQRFTAAKTEKIAVNACATGYILTGIMGIFAIIIGIAAKQILPADTRPDLVYTTFMTELFHPAIGGLFMVTLFAALLTGATSFLLSGATNIVKDIYQEWIKPEATDKEVLKVSRLSVAAMALAGLGVAYLVTDIIGIYMYALTFSAVSMVCPVLAAFFWKGATKTGVQVSIAGSLITALIWKFAGSPYGIHEILPGLIASFLLLVGVSMITEHSPEEDVTAYYYDVKDEIDPALAAAGVTAATKE